MRTTSGTTPHGHRQGAFPLFKVARHSVADGRQNPPRSGGLPCRSAFTLIELLVVIAIVGILVTLSAAAILRFLGTQPRSITRTLINRLDSRLRQQTAYQLDLDRRSQPSTLAFTLANGDTDRARVISQKIRLKQYFPICFAEVFNPGPGIKPVPAYIGHLRSYGITTASATPAAHESAACL